MTDKRFKRLLKKRLGISPKTWASDMHYSIDSIMHFPVGDTSIVNEINSIAIAGCYTRDADMKVTEFGQEYMLEIITHKKILILERMSAYKHIYEMNEL
jgi:hypothetical protein